MSNKITMSSVSVPKKIFSNLCLVTLVLASNIQQIHANHKELGLYKTFEIVIPSFNNEQWAEANLRSVCFQNYPEDKYHITYINDASTDKTKEIVTTFIKNNHLEKRVTLINNTINKGQMENRYRAFHNLPDTTIITECDGDDFYAHNDVLKELNTVYRNPNVWMLYTLRYKTFPENKIYTLQPFTPQEIAQNTFRNFWKRETCQLRSYHTWLFKQIKLKDLLYQGRFYPVLTDPAYMIPMLEMAGVHNQCINEILYIRTTTNPLSVKKKYDKDFRKKVYDDISNKTPYNRLSAPIITDSSRQTQQVELVICCSSIASLDSLIAIAQEKLSGVNTCQVFLELKKGPQIVYKPSTRLPFTIQCTSYDTRNNTLQKVLQDHLTHATNSAIALITDKTLAIDNHIDLAECFAILTESFAPLFYLHSIKDMPQNKAPHVQINPTIWAGQFSYLQSYHKPCALLCTREFLLTKLNAMHVNTIEELNKGIATWTISPDDVCLFFEKHK